MKKQLLLALLFLLAHAARSAIGPLSAVSDTASPLTTTVVNPPVPRGANTRQTSPTSFTLRVFNPSSLPLSNISMEWELLINGTITQKGTSSHIQMPAKNAANVHLPLHLSSDSTDEIFLQVRYHRPPGPVFAEQQLVLRAPVIRPLNIRQNGALSFADGPDTFIIRSPLIHLEFNKQTGWLRHYEVKGTVLFDDSLGLRPDFRLPEDRDTSAGSASWQSAGNHPHLQLFSISTGSELVIVRTEYTMPETSCLLHLSYTINAMGQMLVGQSIEPDTTQLKIDSTEKTWTIPCFGMRWIFSPGFDSVTWYGPPGPSQDSGQTAKAWIGIYHEASTLPTPPDIRSRDNTGKSGIRWWRISGQNGNGLLFSAGSSLLNCSAVTSDIQTRLYIVSSFHLPYGSHHYEYKVTPVITSLR